MSDLQAVPTAKLLAEIVRREGVHPGPATTTYYGTWVETLVMISPDCTAQIRMNADEHSELERLYG